MFLTNRTSSTRSAYTRAESRISLVTGTTRTRDAFVRVARRHELLQLPRSHMQADGLRQNQIYPFAANGVGLDTTLASPEHRPRQPRRIDELEAERHCQLADGLSIDSAMI